MAKIKSSQELAMERTASFKDRRHPGMETEEGKQYSSAAAILARAYLQDTKQLDQLTEAFAGYPAQYREAAVQAALKTAVLSLDMDNCSRALELIGKYRTGNQVNELVRSIRELHRRYLERLQAAEAELAKETRQAVLSQLAEAGISGNAIGEVNLQRSSFWKEATANLAAALAPELARLKERLAEATGINL